MAAMSQYRALVVDDEAIARRMLAFALQREGFACDLAKDGTDASDLLAERSYDVVVTDILMPHKNGHSLAVDLLSGANRPVVIIHTSVDDARLTKDLLVRGVDDIVYKPTNYTTFAVKAATLVQRRRNLRRNSDSSAESAGQRQAPGPASASPSWLDVSREQVEQRLADMSSILPVSRTALEVYQLLTTKEASMGEIARTIERDGALAADVLRLGNSPHYNLSGKSVSNLEQLVIGIGARRVAELALAAGARSSITKQQLPWVNADLVWKHSLAAGIALDLIAAQGKLEIHGKGLFLSALMYPLGRIVLANLFPFRHEALTRECEQTGEALGVAEKRVFFRSHTAITAELLAGWKISAEVTGPLRHVDSPYSSFATLPHDERRALELVKVAVLLGRLAVGVWESWDEVDFPPADVLARLRIRSVRDAIAETHAKVASLTADTRSRSGEPDTVSTGGLRSVGYWNASLQTFDFLAAICPALGVEPISSELNGQPCILANCLDMEPEKPAQKPQQRKGQQLLVITSERGRAQLDSSAHCLVLPSSFRRLQQAVSELWTEHSHIAAAEVTPGK